MHLKKMQNLRKMKGICIKNPSNVRLEVSGSKMEAETFIINLEKDSEKHLSDAQKKSIT